LDRRIAERKTVAEEAATWSQNRNQRQIGVDWQFTNARTKLSYLYPKIAV